MVAARGNPRSHIAKSQLLLLPLAGTIDALPRFPEENIATPLCSAA
jgi:hypothetical protein